MDNYSEEQLLMLSNFVYLGASQNEGTISEVLSMYENADGTFSKESVSRVGIGGGLDADEVSDLFTRMKAECAKDPSFGDLSPARRLEESDIRAVCYTTSSDENPVVVFRGTGGTKEAWRDNVYGAYNDNTRLQNTADEFVRYECGAYEDITVTGHSKGGNLSQYVTVMNDDKISRCVSFDGQGFNDEFIADNAERIAKSAPKIKSICAYNDYVNVLLGAIAGTVLYVNNNESGVNAHSSYHLLASNDFDADGNFTDQKSQSLIAKAIGKVSGDIASVISLMDDGDNFILCTLLGDTVANIVMAEGSDGAAEGIKKSVKEGMAVISVKMNSVFDDKESEIKSLPSGGVYFDEMGIREAAGNFYEHRNMTIRVIDRIAELKEVNDYGFAERIYSNMALERITDRLTDINNRIVLMEEVLESAARRYRAKEMLIASQMESHKA